MYMIVTHTDNVCMHFNDTLQTFSRISLNVLFHTEEELDQQLRQA